MGRGLHLYMRDAPGSVAGSTAARRRHTSSMPRKPRKLPRVSQAQDGLMPYGSYGSSGPPPYGMAADGGGGGGGGASMRASSAPSFDLTAAHGQFHPVRVD